MTRVLITGAASGLGLGTALRLAADGHQVTAAVHTDAQLESTVRHFADAGQAVEVIRLDLANGDDIDQAAVRDIDVLVNNAGYGAQGPILETPLSTVLRTFEVNVFGTLNLTQQVARRMIAQQRAGRVVFISSVAGLFVSPGAGAYGASKFALEAIAREFHQELAPQNITVKVVNPGPFSTGFNERLVENAPRVQTLEADYFEGIFADFLAKQHDPALAVATIVEAVNDRNDTYRYLVPAGVKQIVDEYHRTVERQTETFDTSGTQTS